MLRQAGCTRSWQSSRLRSFMLSSLISPLRRLQHRFPWLSGKVGGFGKRLINFWLGTYPRVMAREISAVTEVLRGTQWNMAYGKGLAHERLEAAFTEYVGVRHAVAVNTGGMALQMSMRGLGLKPGNEVLLQVDTCSATAFSVMNAACVPVFSDISESTFMLPVDQLDEVIGPNTKAVIATHMWGNPERIPALMEYCQSRNLYLIEDACLALGGRSRGGYAGACGDVGIFSFGCLKPIQGGEGGMIVTDDEALAKELRSLRHWGDRTMEYGVRDTTQLAWNGRMSEIVAAVVNEQLRGYPAHLSDLQDAVMEFERFLQKFDGLDLVLGDTENSRNCAFTQVVLRLDKSKFGHDKAWLKDGLASRGVATWHANFELINSLSFFREHHWKDWITKGDIGRVSRNFGGDFPVASRVVDSDGVGLPKINFLSGARLKQLMRQIDALMVRH